MKPLLLKTVLALFSFFTSFTPQAQSADPLPAWVSNKGYWVVESNKKTPRQAIVYFYTNQNQLVYKEEITNQKLNLNKQKTLLRLKAALEEAIDLRASGAWISTKWLVAHHLQD